MSLLYAVVFASRCRSNHHRLAVDALRHLQSPDAEKWQNLLLHYHDDYLAGAKEIIDLMNEASVYKPTLKRAFVINRKIVNTAIGRDVAEVLSTYPIPVFETAICQRVAFAESATQGLTVYELDPEMLAAQEMNQLAKEVEGMLA